MPHSSYAHLFDSDFDDDYYPNDSEFDSDVGAQSPSSLIMPPAPPGSFSLPLLIRSFNLRSAAGDALQLPRDRLEVQYLAHILHLAHPPQPGLIRRQSIKKRSTALTPTGQTNKRKRKAVRFSSKRRKAKKEKVAVEVPSNVTARFEGSSRAKSRRTLPQVPANPPSFSFSQISVAWERVV